MDKMGQKTFKIGCFWLIGLRPGCLSVIFHDFANEVLAIAVLVAGCLSVIFHDFANGLPRRALHGESGSKSARTRARVFNGEPSFPVKH